ncbi:MAG: SusC/RagA family TonB-linked outer membrane protein [Gemmatimonadota bacterium]|nr:SusC/RagA family TonB-linked outer membrane protein [Gemmatimonadota bacterium]
MRVSRLGPLVVGSAVAALVALIPSPLVAQQDAVITGRVMSDRGSPLGGATVTVGATNASAVTTRDGTYRITIAAEAVRGQQAVLTVRFIGYRPATRTMTLEPGTQEQNFELTADPFRLDELVVTGVAEAMSAKKLTFTVGKVTAEQLQDVPGSSALVSLQGKVAGARIIPTSAQPGGEVSIRLRGATSISGTQEPLYIVDGVITRFGLADMAPEDVESIEVIKGAAASSLYGSAAANGVVQVFTKRGRALAEGALQITTRFEAGVNSMPRRLEFSKSHAWQVDANGDYILNATGGRQTEPDQVADNPFMTYYDHWDAMIDPGVYWTGYVSFGQRRGTTNFSASFQNTDNKGVIFGLDGYKRQNFRLNLDQRLNPALDVSFSTFYGTSTNGRAAEGQTGPFFGLMFVQPDVNIEAPCEGSSEPYCPLVPLSGDVANDFNPMYELANREIRQDRNRFTGAARLRWRMLSWLSAEGSFAYDQEAESYSDLQPFGYQTSSGTKQNGDLFRRANNNYQLNADVTLTSIRTFGSITNTTRVAAILENQKNRLLSANAPTLLVAEVPHFAAADHPASRDVSREEDLRNRNYLAITTFDIKDRYILDGLVRRDGSSLFGPDSRWSTYYRVSGAWRVTEDLRIPGVDELRLRGSYGTAGLRPNFDDQYEILAVTPGGFTKQVLGNPDLKPARSAEMELGANLEFGTGRLSVEYSYARKETKDQLLLADLPAVAGFLQQWQNTGALLSKTHEVSFGARMIDGRNTSLTLNIVGDRTRQVITEWSLPDRLYAFQQMPATFFLADGSDLGAMFGTRWIRSVDELYDDPAKFAESGPGQTWDRDNVMINEDGYVVRKDQYGTPDERAIKYTFCKSEDQSGTCVETSQLVQIGDANPDFNLSFGLRFQHKRLVVSGLLDWSYGGDLYNGTRQWAFQATRDRAQDQAGKPQNDAPCGVVADPMPACPQKPLGYYAVGFYNGLDPSDFFVENGSYAKLKELSVHYTFVSDQLRSIGLGGIGSIRLGFIARNLFTITNYSGLDPEVSGLFGDPFQVRMDWFQYPQFRTYSTVVEFTF